MDARQELEELRRLDELERRAAETPMDPSAGGGSLSFGPWDTGIKTPQWLDRTLSGAGKAFSDTGLRAKQIASLNSDEMQAEVNQSRKRDEPLMNTGAGMTGNVLGNIAQMIGPAAGVGMVGKGIPMLAGASSAMIAPKSVLGAAAAGAGYAGLTQPVGTGQSTLGEMGKGAAGGAIFPAAATVFRAGKSIVAPFTKAGQEGIAARTLERFATDPTAIARANPREFVPGSVPMLHEAVDDTGLSQLARTLRNNNDANGVITERMLNNREARSQALKKIAGDPGDIQALKDIRAGNAEQAYAAAMAETPTVTPWIKGEITQLQKRPSFKTAFAKGVEFAKEEGLNLNIKNVTQVLHYTKMGLDDAIAKAAPTEQRLLIQTRNKLVSLMESKDFSPSYRAARQQFAAESRPINQMQVGEALHQKLMPALDSFGPTTRTNAATYARSLLNGDKTARAATGFKGARMENILSPEQLGTAKGVARDLARSIRAEERGLSKGSPTAQNLVSQDILGGVLGPLGLPKAGTAWAMENTGINQMMKAGKLLYSGADENVTKLIAKAMTDPRAARAMSEKELKKRLKNKWIDELLSYSVAPGAAVGLLGQ